MSKIPRGQLKQAEPRLKLMMFSPAGVGKSTASIQMPVPYCIDCENGLRHYTHLLAAKGGDGITTNDFDTVFGIVKAMATEKHEFKTLVIDPITAIYDTMLDQAAIKVGTDFGRHYGVANTSFKRLFNVLSMLDMNVVITAHAKNLYGDKMNVVGTTFDGWKKLDYLFDLVFELQKRGEGPGAKRVAIVRKTRLAAFPDGDNFEWSYDAVADRYGRDKLEADVQAIEFATKEQVAELKKLLDTVRVDEGWLEKCLSKAGVDAVEDLTSDQITKMIDALSKRLAA